MIDRTNVAFIVFALLVEFERNGIQFIKSLMGCVVGGEKDQKWRRLALIAKKKVCGSCRNKKRASLNGRKKCRVLLYFFLHKNNCT